jgi:hypothetical protein
VDGGGWPGAFLDLGKAVDLLPKLSREHPPDLSRIVLVGHSSGERCAAWLAVDFYRMVLADTYMDALVIDSKGGDGTLYCDDPLLDPLVGGRPGTRAEELRQISPLPGCRAVCRRSRRRFRARSRGVVTYPATVNARTFNLGGMPPREREAVQRVGSLSTWTDNLGSTCLRS